MSRSRAESNGGFTLIELLVVIAILAVLAGLILPAIQNALMRAKISSIRQELDNLALAVESYAIETGSYPEPVNPAWTSDLYPWYIKQLIDTGDLTQKGAREFLDQFAPNDWETRRRFYRYYTLMKNAAGDGVPPCDSFVLFSVGPDEHGFLMVDQDTGEVDPGTYLPCLFDPALIDTNHDSINDFDYDGIASSDRNWSECRGEVVPNNAGNSKVKEICEEVIDDVGSCRRCDGIILRIGP